MAVEALEFLIESVLFKKSREVSEQTNVAQAGTTEPEQAERIAENIVPESVKIKEEKAEPKQPEMTRLASKYPKFSKLRKNWTNKKYCNSTETKTAFCKEKRTVRSQRLV